MALRYRLLLLDHDDTSVASTETIHYPAHIASVNQLRPDLVPCSLEQWFEVVSALTMPSLRRCLLVPRKTPRGQRANPLFSFSCGETPHI